MKPHNNNRYKIVQMVFITILPLFFACEKWLHVLPDNETEAQQLFSTERGFQEALSGVYTLMSEPELYGREMTYGMVEVIAQQYGPLHETSPYYYPQYFDFKINQSLQLSDMIWKKQYNTIANINDLLAFIDTKKSIFASEISYSLIKGEALALRAYLHLDLLRLYAPAPNTNSETKNWLPYVDQFSKNTAVSLSINDYMDKVLQDLSQAEALLQQDPIVTGKPSTDLYFKNRSYHLNYYAVKGLLARAYLYRGSSYHAKAYTYAKEIIEAHQSKGLFPFVTELDATNTERNKRDRTFSTEHLFTLNIRALQEFTIGYVTQVQASLALIPREPVPDIYENYPDYRQEFFERDGAVQNVPSKFWQVDPTKKNNYKMPMLRLAEMYYIAAETAGNTTEAITLLQTVRDARNIPVPLQNSDPVSLQDEIYKEYKKEFFGEGQLFYYYKRHNAADAGIGTLPFKYILPMPEDEINFANRPRPL